MDQLKEHRALIKRLLREHERLENLQPTSGVEALVIFDEERNHYLLMRLGWEGHRRVRQIVLQVRLRDGKFWIEEDWTEEGLATDLMRAGISNRDIVLAFHPPDVRPLTEFAALES